MTSTYPKELNYVLYFLHGLPDVRNESKYEKLERYILRNYDGEKFENLYSSVEWAVEHLDYDFKAIDPGLRHCKEDVVIFLNNFYFMLQSIK